jgi:hypothetical protein
MNVIQTNFEYRKPLIPLNLDKVLFIVVHHPEAITATPEQIHQWHLERDGGTWAGFGYNEYIRKDGTVYIGRGDNIGAQCANMNSKSYGICCEGNYDVETKMPEAQFNALVERIKFHKARFKNLLEVAPHSKYYATSCPGRYFPMQQVMDEVNRTLTPRLRVNGNFLNAELIIKDGRMYVPVRVLSVELGKTVTWDDVGKVADVV